MENALARRAEPGDGLRNSELALLSFGSRHESGDRLRPSELNPASYRNNRRGW